MSRTAKIVSKYNDASNIMTVPLSLQRWFRNTMWMRSHVAHAVLRGLATHVALSALRVIGRRDTRRYPVANTQQ